MLEGFGLEHAVGRTLLHTRHELPWMPAGR